MQTSLVSSRVNDDSETTESIAPPKDASFKTVLYTNDMCASPYAPPSYPLEKDKELRVSLFYYQGSRLSAEKCHSST